MSNQRQQQQQQQRATLTPNEKLQLFFSNDKNYEEDLMVIKFENSEFKDLVQMMGKGKPVGQVIVEHTKKKTGISENQDGTKFFIQFKENQESQEYNHKYQLLFPKIYTNTKNFVASVTTDYDLKKKLISSGKDYLPLKRDIAVTQKQQINFGCEAGTNINKKYVQVVQDFTPTPSELQRQQDCLQKRKIEDLLSSDEDEEGDQFFVKKQVKLNEDKQQSNTTKNTSSSNNENKNNQNFYEPETEEMKAYQNDTIKQFLRRKGEATAEEIFNGALIDHQQIKKNHIKEFLQKEAEKFKDGTLTKYRLLKNY